MAHADITEEERRGLVELALGWRRFVEKGGTHAARIEAFLRAGSRQTRTIAGEAGARVALLGGPLERCFPGPQRVHLQVTDKGPATGSVVHLLGAYQYHPFAADRLKGRAHDLDGPQHLALELGWFGDGSGAVRFVFVTLAEIKRRHVDHARFLGPVARLFIDALGVESAKCRFGPQPAGTKLNSVLISGHQGLEIDLWTFTLDDLLEERPGGWDLSESWLSTLEQTLTRAAASLAALYAEHASPTSELYRNLAACFERKADVAPPPPTHEQGLPVVLNEEQLWQHLEEKRAVVLEGPPGTGKTHLALALVDWLRLRRDGATVESRVVQMHPGYAYEDLVQGMRPVAGGHFEVQPGPFLALCRRAADQPDARFVFILDEMNRCNAAAVFGELLYALERNAGDREPVDLQYEGTLSLPPNVYLIGTMNTADRSIALVDFAIRRRFRFLRVPARREALEGFYAENPWPEAAALARRAWDELDRAQRKHLAATHLIGPAFLMVKRHGERPASQLLANNIVYEILPQLREYERESVPGAKSVWAAKPFDVESTRGDEEAVERIRAWLASAPVVPATA